MSGKLQGRVAFITGAARGQGRSHAVLLAKEGADIIAVDICGPNPSPRFPGTSEEDLAETVRQVEALDRRIVAAKADVRDEAALKAALETGIAELGRLDIVLANAGVAPVSTLSEDLALEDWQTNIDVNLTGAWLTAKVAIPHIKAGERGGSIVLTSSAAGLQPYANISHYIAAKHGVVGLMRALALELAPFSIRVNSVHPTQVDTPLMMNSTMFEIFRPDLEEPTVDDAAEASLLMNALPVPWVDPIDISHAVLYLASDDARYVTGVTLPVDAGALINNAWAG